MAEEFQALLCNVMLYFLSSWLLGASSIALASCKGPWLSELMNSSLVCIKISASFGGPLFLDRTPAMHVLLDGP